MGTAPDECNYTPDTHNVKKAAYDKVYMSGAKTNGTYAAQLSNPDLPCSSHQAAVGTAADSCNYTPDTHNVKKAAYDKVYMSGAKTNGTYAAQVTK